MPPPAASRAAPAGPRYLMKDVDYFAGFAHALHTYLSGVALASRHGMQLLHVPFQAAHGLGYAFDDFLAADPRGLVAPLAAPLLEAGERGTTINGEPVTLHALDRRLDAARIGERLANARPRTLSWVRKGRFAFEERERAANFTLHPEVRHAALCWARSAGARTR